MHVKINQLEINNLIKNTNFDKLKHWLSSNPFGIIDLKIKDIINFLVIYDSINCFFGEIE